MIEDPTRVDIRSTCQECGSHSWDQTRFMSLDDAEIYCEERGL